MVSSFIVKKSDTTTSVTYTLRGNTASTAEYIDATSLPSAPRLIKTSHAMKPIGSTGSDRHTLLTQHVFLDSDDVPRIISDSRTVTVPRSPVVTMALVKDAMAASDGVMNTAGFRDAFIQGISL